MDASETIIVETAGRDSFAAVIKFCRENKNKQISLIPTYVRTGTEYGDLRQVEENVGRLRERVELDYQARLDELIVLEKPELWWALNGRFLSVLDERYGFYTPCLGCHLYAHLLRLPLARERGTKRIIGGERESHGTRIKLNQIPEALDAYQAVLAGAGLRLELPVRKIASEEEIIELVGPGWPAGEKQMKCVLSANYAGLDWEVDYSREKMRKFLDEFLIPVGDRIASALFDGQTDYLGLVKEVLENRNLIS